MKKILAFGVMIIAMKANSQILVNVQLPPNGIMQKNQLWNMTVTNTGATTLSLHIELTFSDAVNSIQIIGAATQVFSVPPGASQLSNAVLQPIQYNILSQAYPVDAGPNGLLPVGDFEVCYSFMSHTTDAVEKIAEECQELLVEPLSPPQLVYPYDQDVIENKNPQFSWLPPLPRSLFSNLTYDLDLTEVYPNQTPADAIQQNVPIFQQQGISVTTLLYPVSAQMLELDKQYAWRVIAKSNQMQVAQSETWAFSIKEFNRIDSIEISELPFAKLKKDDRGGYAIFVNELKFDYLNENSDTSWNISLVDLSVLNKKSISLSLDTIKLIPGQNLIKYNISDNADFIDKHLYLLEIINSRKESWRLRFEYRKPQE